MYRTSRTLRFGDCDPSGIAYFPAYLDLLVGVVEDFFATVAVSWPELIGRRRIGTPTARLEVDFIAPGRHGDVLDFTLAVRSVGRSSLELAATVQIADTTVWKARQVLVATSLDTHRSQPWPDEIRAAFERHLEV